MKYSSFFSTVLKAQGLPKVSDAQIQRMMNIVSLEGQLKGYKSVAPAFQHDENFKLMLFKKQCQLTDLTGNLKEEDLLKEMFFRSRDQY